jgi:flavin-dependent dehydrogenase
MFDGSHPREKPCGGGVTQRALDLVRDAVDVAAIPSRAVTDATFEHGGHSVALRIAVQRGAPLLVMSRRDFDGALLDAAIGAGARFITSRVRRIDEERCGWSLGSNQDSVVADWLLGADGANSLVRRTVHAPFARRDLSIATGVYVHGCSSSTISIGFEDRPAGYLWSFPRTDHLAVGACAQADESSPAALLPIVTRWIDRNVAPGMRLEKYSWPIPSLTGAAIERERPSGRRWMLLGDAGGMVDPITREGIYFALASADAAADSLADHAGASRLYEDRIRDGVYAELRRAAALKSRFFNPPFTGLLIDALRASAAVRGVMVDLIAGTQTYRGLRRRLLRTLEVRLAARLLRHVY